jgi:MSHA pilin protein MshD
MCFSQRKKNSKGFTLLEVLVTVVVIAIAATAIMSVFSSTIRRSADPLIQQQAIAIAEAYIEEIQTKAFSDPDQVETGGAEAGESRATFDDVQDYNGISGADVEDQNVGGVGIDLTAYDVSVSVNAATLGGQSMMRIQVSVDHAAISPIVLAVYRANY